jgi:hypothetical protein
MYLERISYLHKSLSLWGFSQEDLLINFRSLLVPILVHVANNHVINGIPDPRDLTLELTRSFSLLNLELNTMKRKVEETKEVNQEV